MFRKKKPQPSLADRAAQAQATAELALFSFQNAIDSLDAASEQHDAVMAEAQVQADHFDRIVTEASFAAYEAGRKADKLRELFA